MTNDFQPGDVAMVNDCTNPEAPWKAATCVSARTPKRETVWRLHDTGRMVWSNVSDARRLAVIDPESDADVARMENALEAQGCRVGTGVRAALRKFAGPTASNPEEPTDATARVADFRENIWRLLADGDWVCTSGPDIGEYLVWDRLASTRGPLTVEVTP